MVLHPPAAAQMDVLTGRAAREVYFDPTKLLAKDGKILASTVEESKLAEMLYKPVKVVQELPNENVIIVRDELDQVHRLAADGVLTVKPEAQAGVPDILELNDFSEMSLLMTLRARYQRDEVYTFVGPIIISINPYKWNHDLYSEGNMIQYHTLDADHLPPHLFTVADSSYIAFINDGSKVPANQSIIISGESGAGKTEAMKIIMQYLARITHYKVATTDSRGSPSTVPHLEVGELENKVLSTNPFLESFGNAKTLMNDNSSRFGKYVKIQFGPSGRIVGAEITNYLLEKTRIVRQAEGERNFHIFYQLIRGGDDQLLADLHLTHHAGSFRYLTHGHCTEIQGKSDIDDFEITKECMASIGIDSGLQRTMFELIAAVLHLGNVSFVDLDDGASAVDQDSVEHLQLAARFLRLDPEEMRRTFCSKQISTRQDETLVSPNNASEASDKRDTLAKSVYACVFNWLVRRLNVTIAAEKSWGFMGVLDIYGFEAFENNSFEQLLINFANETLQNQFNRHIFEMEQEDYEREGIDWSYVSFNDNQPCLALLDNRYYREPAGTSSNGGAAAAAGPGKPPVPCLFNILDDVKIVGGGDALDSRFISSLHSAFAGKSEAYVKPRLHADMCFGVKHYAGEVIYTVDGFVERNVENLHQNVRALALSSSDPLIRDEIFLDIKQMEERVSKRKKKTALGKEARGSRLREASLSSQFRTSLASLVETLDLTSPRYVRCIKPNHEKLAGYFHTSEILRQLRYAGMMEAIRIRQQGYALRESHSVMYHQFARLVPNCKSLPELVELLSRMLNVGEREWQIGVSKIFMKKTLADKLHRLLEIRVKLGARSIQRAWICMRKRQATAILQRYSRGYLARRHFRGAVRSVGKVQTFWRMGSTRKRYLAKREASIKVQAQARRYIAVKQMQRLNNRYAKLSEDEIIRMIIETEAEAATAADRKAFDVCEELAHKLKMLKLALEQVRGAAEPLPFASREELEGKITVSEGKMEDLSKRKDYAACSKLQAQLKELIAFRMSLPTRQDIVDRIGALQNEIDELSKAKKFKACDEVQLQIKVLEVKYKDVLEAKEDSAAAASCDYTSRQELEHAIQQANEELASLEAQKRFADCTAAQANVDRLCSLRTIFPTASEKEAEAEKLAELIQQAGKDYNYAECDRLQHLVDEARAAAAELRTIEQASEAAALVNGGSTSMKRSRTELQAEIVKVKKQMDDKLATKDFGSCDALQKELILLETELAALPTLAQLEATLADLKSQMEQSLASKNFAACAPLQIKIDQVTADRDAALAAQPVISSAEVLTTCRLASPLTSTSVRPRVTSSTSKSVVSSVNGSAAPSVVPSVKGGHHHRHSSSHSKEEDVRASWHAVSKLRPDKALVLPSSSSVAALARSMVQRRAVAVLLTGPDGNLDGILTDTDVTRRVIAKELSVEGTKAADVMTTNPLTVSMDDCALDALSTMVKGGFRHLPVLDHNNAVVGCLDMAKCLSDAITRLEKLEERHARHHHKTEKAGPNLEMASMAMALAGQAKGKGQQQALMSTLLQLLSANGEDGDEAGTELPTVGKILSESAATAILSAGTDVTAASKEMASSRKACLVVEGNKLLGLVTCKDILDRVVVKGQPPKQVTLGSIMTPQPTSVTPDMTLLDALYMMRDGHFLNLPVVEEGSGRALGLLNAMEIVQGLARLTGKDDGGRSFWAQTMGKEDEGWESQSDAGSIRSSTSRRVDGQPARKGAASVVSSAKGDQHHRHKEEDVRASWHAVSKLRPDKALVLPSSSSVAALARSMVQRRAVAVLLTGPDGNLDGILTDTDVTRRVIAKELSVEGTKAADVMTTNPLTVSMDDCALDALSTMVKGGFRHLPVLDHNNDVVGCLDIAKCLSDAITRLEKLEERHARHHHKTEKAGPNLEMASMAMALAGQAKGKGQQQALMSTLLQLLSANGEDGDEAGTELPTVGKILSESAATAILSAGTDVTAASKEMASSRKACLVVEGNKLLGLVTCKDILDRVVVKGQPPKQVTLGSIMTPQPTSVTPDMTLLDALYMMRDGHFLNLPVVEEGSGRALGLLNAMEIVQGLARLTGKDDGGRSFWAQTMGKEDEGWESQSDAGSIRSSTSRRVDGQPARKGAASVVSSAKGDQHHRHKEEDVRASWHAVSKLRPDKALVLPSSSSVAALARSMVQRRAVAVLLTGPDGNLDGILTDTDVTRRVIAKELSVEGTKAADVMTTNPLTVSMDDCALDALSTMVKGGFRHLPVLDHNNDVVGCLDIAKCLSDAITRLEKLEERHARHHHKTEKAGPNLEMASMAMALAGQAKGKGQQQALMSTLLQLLSANGEDGDEAGTELPTVGKILSESAATAILSAGTDVTAASKEMASSRKACLVVEGNKLLGLVTCKDILDRVVVKGQPPKQVTLGSIMTPQPTSVTPDMTLLDALYMMRDGHFLNLPVVEEGSGRALGLLNAMEIVQGLARLTGKDDGGRSFWAQTMGKEDEGWESQSDAGSIRSSTSRRVDGQPARKGAASVVSSAKGDQHHRHKEEDVRASWHAVSKLRPDKALVLPSSSSVAALARSMVERRAVAVLLTGQDGNLDGILTDTDVTRRVIAKELSVEGTKAADVMTTNPLTVSMDDCALDALSTMVKGGFRHLPVLDHNNAVVGCLDIAKCLSDAITRLERMEERRARHHHKTEKSGPGLEMASMAMALAGQAKSKGQQQALMSTLLQLLSANGEDSDEADMELPTVGKILSESAATAMLSAGTNVTAASKEMAASRKACLVVEGSRLWGLVTCKDVLCRVVYKGQSPKQVTLGSIMTPQPTSVTPDMTLLDALYMMRDGHFLNLPVVEEGSGRALGLLNAMEIVQGLARLTGKDDGGYSFWAQTVGENGEGWESQSDAGSIKSFGRPPTPAFMPPPAKSPLPMEADPSFRPVSKLRPKPPLVIDNASCTVLEAAKVMVAKRTDSVLITSKSGSVMGILTDNDVTRRVVAQYRGASETKVSEIMTENPKAVSMESCSLDALTAMVKGRFRHLPVMSASGEVVGLLDIAKCLSDTITRLERNEEKKTSSLAAAASGKEPNILQLIQLLHQKAEPGKDHNPTLRKLLERKGAPANIVRPSANVRTTAEAMKRTRKAALVVDDEGGLVGIFTPTDMLARVVAKDLSPDFTAVASVMTSAPDTIEADATALDALYMMREDHYLHIPVTGADGQVIGLVDAMEIVEAVVGEDGGRRFWASAHSGGKNDDSVSEISSSHPPNIRFTNARPPILMARGSGDIMDPEEKQHIDAHPIDPNEELESASMLAAGRGLHSTGRSHSVLDSTVSGMMRSKLSSEHAMDGAHFRLKVVAEGGGTTKTVTVPIESYEAVMEAIYLAFDIDSSAAGSKALTYLDDQKDVITVDSDETLGEMLAFAQENSLKVLKVSLVKCKKKKKNKKDRDSRGAVISITPDGVAVGGTTIAPAVAAGGLFAAIALVSLFVMSRKK